MTDKKEKDGDSLRAAVRRMISRPLKTEDQVDSRIIDALMSSAAGLKAYRLWRATDWEAVALTVLKISDALQVVIGLEARELCEHRWIEIEREIDECKEFPADDREQALDLLGAFVDKGLMR